MVDLKIKLFLLLIIISTDLYAVKITPLGLIHQGDKNIYEVKSFFEGQRVNDYVECYELVFVIGNLTKNFISKFNQPSNEEDDILGCGIVNSSFVDRVKESAGYAGKICSSNAYFQFSEARVPYTIAIESNEKINNLSEQDKNKLRGQILSHFEYVSSLDCCDELMTIGEEDVEENKRRDIYNFHDSRCGNYVKGADECSKCKVIKQLGVGKFNTTHVIFFDREEMDEG